MIFLQDGFLSHALKVKVKVKSLIRVRLFATLWTVGHQAPPSMGFPRQEYWSGLPFPSPGDLPDPGIEPRSPSFQADALTSEPPGKPHMPWGNQLIIKKKWSILKPDLEYRCIAKSSISCEMRTFGLAWTKFSKGMELVPDPPNHLKVASTALYRKLLMSPHCSGISGYPGMQAVEKWSPP